jgi:protoporphyrinogen oxidase
VDALVSVPGGRIRTQSEAIAIDAAAHSVTTASGQKVRYDQLVSTLPLPVLLSALDPLPLELRSLLGSHRDWYEVFPCTRLTVVEIGSKESGPGLAAHWTYFPDADQPFYRLVRLEAISPDLAPPGGTSLLLECQGHRSVDQSKILSFLSSIHVLPRAQADHFAVRHVAYAYALFTPSAREASRRARVCLDQLGIQSVGRYGTWTYASVEDAVRSGIGAAERLRRPPPALHGAPP